jgi:hypothetical protein
MRELRCDILVAGGGTGGVAAALAAAEAGCQVILTEETDWLGGQLTSQAVPPDESRWIESFGCTARYRRFREGVRDYYRRHYPLTPEARANPRLNPGGGSVSRLCAEPSVYEATMRAMLQPHVMRGHLRLFCWQKPVAASTDGDRVTSVTFRHLLTGEERTVHAGYVLDATELGDLLPLAGIEYVSGAESRADTGEPHAVEGSAQPENVQSLTWCFPMAFDPHGEHVIDKPAQYDRWRDYVPPLTPAWPGKMLSWTYTHPITLEPMPRCLFPEESPENPSKGLWLYRRLVCREHYPADVAPHEVTLVNWPQNDYVEGNLIDAADDDVETHLEAARQQSLSLFYWMQTEAPRPDGGTGYPGLYLRPDITGTDDGLAKMPYIRESRRIKARFTVTENHVGREARGSDTAAPFADSVGIGSYRIDLHPSTGGDNYIDISSLPFQIPLGALVPERAENLLPACKNLGVTHITNGCYRLHPVEWNIGEAAGELAAYCLRHGTTPAGVHESADETKRFQDHLTAQGVELAWPQVHAV